MKTESIDVWVVMWMTLGKKEWKVDCVCMTESEAANVAAGIHAPTSVRPATLTFKEEPQ